MYYQEVIEMSVKKIIGIMMVTILTLFLLTAGVTAAFSQQSKDKGIVDDVGDIEDSGDQGNGTDEDDGSGNSDDHRDDDNETDDDEDDENDDNETDDDEDEEDDDYDDEDEENEGSIGHFEEGTDGKFVSFELIEDEIRNYTINRNNGTIRAFDKVTIEDFIIDDEESKGSFYEVEGEDDIEIRIYDVYPGILKINSESEGLFNISFDLGDFEVNGKDGRNLNLTYENHTAKMLAVTQGPPDNVPGNHNEGENGNGNPPVNITPPVGPKKKLDIVVENGFVNYSSTADMFIMFRMTDAEDEKESEMEENISHGISKGEIGGEVEVDKDNGGYKEVSLSYADMSIMTQVQDKNRVRMMVSSDTLGENGTIVAAEISRSVLNADDVRDIKVAFDGKNISMADDYEDLKNSSDGAEYLISIGQDKVQVLVMVPHFSTHSIDIFKSVSSIAGTSDIIGNLSYYLPAVLITSLIIVSTVWINKKR